MPQDYEAGRLYFSEWLLALVKGVGILALVAYVFYRSLIVFLVSIPLLSVFLMRERRKTVKKRKDELMLQFRELMHAIIASLQAGYSVENAFLHSYEDMRLLYGKDAMVCRELRQIGHRLKNNENLEDVLTDWAERSHIQDITDFAEVFRIAKRSGGDLPGILNNTAQLISDRIEVQREIGTLIASKKMEQSIMNLVPFGIILYIDATSPGFFDPLYGSGFGVALMTGLLAVYMAAYLLAEKILKIEW
ncbi:MAG: type II secretion system F family protein [Lachnospiraceae bacterium]|nr:type II secretion system F family protein [Lachnospiraceae bacterium]